MAPDSAKNEFKSLYRSRRVVIAILLMLALYCTISMRSHIGVAMVCMVNATAVSELAVLQTPRPDLDSFKNNSFHVFGIQSPFDESRCRRVASSSNNVLDGVLDADGYKGTFVWSTEQQALLFSAGFYGNVCLMFFSGLLVDRFGPSIVCLISMVGMTATILLIPLVANTGYYLFFVNRFVFGMFENPILPALADIVARWFPAHERSTVAAFFTSGNQLSASLGVVIGSSFCTLDWLSGWPLIFYLSGVLGLIWVVSWTLLGTNFPSKSKFLSEGERQYLFETNEQYFTTFRQRKQSGLKMPLKRMVLSKATLAVVMAQFSFNFSNTMMQTYLPTYLRDVMNLALNENGIYTAVPFFVQLFSKNILGNVADMLKKRNIMTASAACKLFQSIASFGGAFVYLIMAVYVDCTTPYVAMALLGIFGFCFGGAIPGSYTSSLSIAPSYTGMIASFTLIAGCVGNILAPAVVGMVVKQGTRFEWSIVFGLVALVNVFGGAVFYVYGTAKVQPWAQSTIPSVAATVSTHRGGHHNRNNAVRLNKDKEKQAKLQLN